MTINRTHIKTAALALAMAVALPALADSTEPVQQTTRETTTTTSDNGAVTSSTTTTTKRHYVYYADHDIYFAPESKTYYWQSNGNWTSGNTLPTESQAYVRGRGVTIELDTDKPYERNDYVIAHYKNHRDDDGQR